MKIYLILLLLVSLLCVSCADPGGERVKARQKKDSGYGHVGNPYREAK